MLNEQQKIRTMRVVRVNRVNLSPHFPQSDQRSLPKSSRTNASEDFCRSYPKSITFSIPGAGVRVRITLALCSHVLKDALDRTLSSLTAYSPLLFFTR